MGDELNMVHRDLAARNVLIDSLMTGKVADFGLSRDIEEYAYYYVQNKVLVPIRWTALEALELGSTLLQATRGHMVLQYMRCLLMVLDLTENGATKRCGWKSKMA